MSNKNKTIDLNVYLVDKYLNVISDIYSFFEQCFTILNNGDKIHANIPLSLNFEQCNEILNLTSLKDLTHISMIESLLKSKIEQQNLLINNVVEDINNIVKKQILDNLTQLFINEFSVLEDRFLAVELIVKNKEREHINSLNSKDEKLSEYESIFNYFEINKEKFKEATLKSKVSTLIITVDRFNVMLDSNINNIMILNAVKSRLLQLKTFGNLILNNVENQQYKSKHSDVLSRISNFKSVNNDLKELLKEHLNSKSNLKKWLVLRELDNYITNSYEMLLLSEDKISKYIITFTKAPVISKDKGANKTEKEQALMKDIIRQSYNYFKSFEIFMFNGINEPVQIKNINTIYEILYSLFVFKTRN